MNNKLTNPILEERILWDNPALKAQVEAYKQYMALDYHERVHTDYRNLDGVGNRRVDHGFNTRRITLFVREETITLSAIGTIIWTGPNGALWDRKASKQLTFSRRGGRLNVYYKGYMKLQRKSVFMNVTNQPWAIYDMFSAGLVSPGWDDEFVRQIHNLQAEVASLIQGWFPEAGPISTNIPSNLQLAHTILRAAYPMLRSVEEMPPMQRIPASVSTPLRNTDPKTCVKKLLGSSGKTVQKGVYRSLKEGNMNTLRLATLLKDQLPLEYIVHILNEGLSMGTMDVGTEDKVIKEFFAQFTPKRVKTLLDSTKTDAGYTAPDTIRMWAQFKDMEEAPELRRCRTFNEMHRELILFSNRHVLQVRLRDEENAPIPQENYNEIHGVIAELDPKLEIRTPQGTHDMLIWGAEMDHCIGSYAYDALQGRGLYFGLYYNGNLLATAEVTKDYYEGGMTVRQLYGVHNSSVDTKIAKAFLYELFKAEILSTDTYKDALERWADRSNLYNPWAPRQMDLPAPPMDDDVPF